MDGERPVDGNEPGAELIPEAVREAGSSLLGVLLVLFILGSLAALVYVTMGPGTDHATRLDMAPDAGQGEGAGATGAPSPIAGATAGACKATYQAVEAAQAAKNAKEGSNAASVAQLVAEGWLSQTPSTDGYTIDLEVVDGDPTGRVLVNGTGGIEACESLP